jgi:hypothetical protein
MYLPVCLASTHISSKGELDSNLIDPIVTFLKQSQFAISMTKSQLQISQFLWGISDNFCPRIIVIEGRIQWVSTIGRSPFIVNILWLPSSIKLISSQSVSEKKSIRSVVIENQSNLEGIESKSFEKSGLTFITIPDSVLVLGEQCFSECKSLSSVTFESGSRLSRIEKWAFRETRLVDIVIPSSVEFLGDSCFCKCGSFSSVTFESGSKLSRIENH